MIDVCRHRRGRSRLRHCAAAVSIQGAAWRCSRPARTSPVGASRANSAIVHAGYDCKPGTNMARVNVAGNALFDEWCRRSARAAQAHRFAGRRAFDEEEMEKVASARMSGAVQNGVPDMELLGRRRDAGTSSRCLAENAVALPLRAAPAAITCPYEMTIACAENAA